MLSFSLLAFKNEFPGYKIPQLIPVFFQLSQVLVFGGRSFIFFLLVK
jgi:hypothetical protein